MIQDLYQRVFLDVKSINRAKCKTQLKGMSHFKKTSKNKIAAKNKEVKKIPVNYVNVPVANSKR